MLGSCADYSLSVEKISTNLNKKQLCFFFFLLSTYLRKRLAKRVS